jgi:catechol 2,3-dioxygenase-like lactoylglutathione lyase family enzyme
MTNTLSVTTPRAYLGLHHVGFSVGDLDRSIAFYSVLLEVEPFVRRFCTEQINADILGYPGARLDVAYFLLGGTQTLLELLAYDHPPNATVNMETFNVGNAHLCLVVEDLQANYDRLTKAGIKGFRSPGPVDVPEIPDDPAPGGKAIYLRDPDGISIELLELPEDGARF